MHHPREPLEAFSEKNLFGHLWEFLGILWPLSFLRLALSFGHVRFDYDKRGLIFNDHELWHLLDTLYATICSHLYCGNCKTIMASNFLLLLFVTELTWDP
jgi:hypothetical protein